MLLKLHSSMNISETSGRNAIKFYLKHHLVSGFHGKKQPQGYNGGKRCYHFRFSVVFHLIFCITAGNKGMHKSSDEFEAQPDPTTDFGVSCHWSSRKMVAFCLLCLIFIYTCRYFKHALELGRVRISVISHN